MLALHCSNTTLASFGYTVDNVGNRTAITFTSYADGTTSNYLSLKLRLTKETGMDSSDQYKYDDVVTRSPWMGGGSEELLHRSPRGAKQDAKCNHSTKMISADLHAYASDSCNGLMTRKIDPEGGYTNYLYDSNYNLTRKTTPSGNWDYEYDSNRLTKETNLGGGVTEYDLDSNGLRTKVRQLIAGTSTVDTDYTYNGNGQVLTKIGP